MASVRGGREVKRVRLNTRTRQLRLPRESIQREDPDIELGSRLRALRRARSFSLEHVARKIGVSAAKLSRIETGSSRAPREVVESLLGVLNAPEVDRTGILNVAREVSWMGEPGVQLHLGRPNSDNQSVLSEAERTCQVMRSLDCVLVPGLLQTAAYSAGAFRATGLQDDETVAEAVRRRMKRQSMLFEKNKKFEFLITEGALRNRYVSIDEMRTQYQQIISLASLSNIRFAVIPFSKRLPALQYPMAIYDNTISFNEYRPGLTVASRHEVDIHRDIDMFERMASIALWAEEATEFVYRLLRDSCAGDGLRTGEQQVPLP